MAGTTPLSINCHNCRCRFSVLYHTATNYCERAYLSRVRVTGQQILEELSAVLFVPLTGGIQKEPRYPD